MIHDSIWHTLLLLVLNVMSVVYMVIIIIHGASLYLVKTERHVEAGPLMHVNEKVSDLFLLLQMS